jgi:hypothetical protein
MQEAGPSKPSEKPVEQAKAAAGKQKKEKKDGLDHRIPDLKTGVQVGSSSLEAAQVLIEAAARVGSSGNPKTALRHLQSVAMLCQARLQGGPLTTETNVDFTRHP